MEGIRIYVPEIRLQEPYVKQAVDSVVADGATLYSAVGTWTDGKKELMTEGVLVIEVLDCHEERRQAIDLLAAALLEAGEEAVLEATQQIITRWRTKKSPPSSHSQALPHKQEPPIRLNGLQEETPAPRRVQDQGEGTVPPIN